MRFASITKFWISATAVFLLALSAVDVRAAIEGNENDVPHYVITHVDGQDGLVPFIASKNGTFLMSNTNIANVVNAIRADAGGLPCVIQFGNEARGALYLPVGAIISFNNSQQQGRWGDVTLTGNLNAAGSPAIRLDNDVVVNNMANITVTGDAIALHMSSSLSHIGGQITGDIANNGTGTVTIVGDTTTRVNGIIINYSTGTVLVDVVTAVSPLSNAAVNTIDNRGAGEVRISRGKVLDVYNTAGGMVTVDGGEIWSIRNLGGGSVMIGGGTVGGIFTHSAIVNSANGTVTIYGSATVTSRAGGIGTINNNLANTSGITESGSIVISGGTVSNNHHDSGVVILNSSNSGGSITISGGTIDGGNGAAIRSVGGFVNISGGTITAAGTATTISNVGGFTEIRGGMVSNTGTASSGSGAIQVIYLDTISSFVPMLSISGTTTSITSRSGAPTVHLITSSHNMADAGVADITGGRITNTASTVGGANSIAIESINARLNISGTTEIASNSIYSCYGGTISIIGSSSELYILGGNVSNTADSNGVAVTFTVNDAYFLIGGSPAINGLISLGCYEDPLIPNVITTGDSAFTPGDKNYTIVANSRLSELQTIVKNGARAASSFTIVSVDEFWVRENDGFALAIDDNDIVAVKDTPARTVTFDINGAAGMPPYPVSVVEGSTLGEFARPFAEAYIRDGFSNDGKWYRRGTQLPNGEWLFGDEFKFGTGFDGTPVNNDMALILLWVPTSSIFETDRETPDPNGSDAETAAVLPVVVVTGGFTAGPNPVVGSAGIVRFFYGSASRPLSGTLMIYDAGGNFINRISIAGDYHGDMAQDVSVPRELASWDLTDRRGRPVPEGTYLVRGSVVAANGAKENVSVILGVVR
ncbi:MAG: carbohydrate-binding domain-containing protein [Chitinispirillales bacterium]|jgi:hypothetical protein|nr:carbohydrate-binding domain-containing protein [Chitinispirillales bacterium]